MAFVTLERDGGVVEIVLGRPPVNALNVELLKEIHEAVKIVAEDDSVRAVLFRSGIPGIFVAGADLNEFKEEATSQAAMEAFHGCFNDIDKLPKPTVAA